MKAYKIAAIPGDGIGNEVLPEGIRVLEAVSYTHLTLPTILLV